MMVLPCSLLEIKVMIRRSVSVSMLKERAVLVDAEFHANHVACNLPARRLIEEHDATFSHARL